MNIPKKIKVGARYYIVLLVDKIDENKPNDDDYTGLTTHTQLTIKIKKGKQEAMEHTFCHELFHAFQCGLPEDLVESLAGNLHEFIKDNPGVFK